MLFGDKRVDIQHLMGQRLGRQSRFGTAAPQSGQAIGFGCMGGRADATGQQCQGGSADKTASCHFHRIVPPRNFVRYHQEHSGSNYKGRSGRPAAGSVRGACFPVLPYGSSINILYHLRPFSACIIHAENAPIHAGLDCSRRKKGPPHPIPCSSPSLKRRTYDETLAPALSL